MSKKSLSIYHGTMTGGGGVCTFTVNTIKRLHEHFDITLVTQDAPPLLLIELSKYADITNRPTPSDYAIIASLLNKRIPITAPKVVQVIHADYNHITTKFRQHASTTHYVAVGHHVARSFTSITGIKIDKVIHNLLDTEPGHQKQHNNNLTLITASRISKEKGFERMIELANLLPPNTQWDVYGKLDSNYAKSILRKSPPMLRYHGYTNDIAKKIAKADYLVQLSDTEGFPYATYEALQQLTPVIVTDFPAAKEQVTDGVNGWILDMELSNYKKILQDKLKLSTFVELSNPQDWVNFLDHGK